MSKSKKRDVEKAWMERAVRAETQRDILRHAVKACVAHFEGPPTDYSAVYSAALKALDDAEGL